MVRADRELVARLLAHLLRVALAAGARAVEVEAAEEDGIVRVAVRDDGTPAGDDPFAPFARARGRGPLVGAGVGLTVSRRLVELHGGTITLGQEADGATLVTFTLPGGGVAVRVLLCDDTAELRSLLRYALESGGGVEIVGEVGDGDVAVQLAADEQPDVVVLDLEMPGPDPEAPAERPAPRRARRGARDLLRPRARRRGRRGGRGDRAACAQDDGPRRRGARRARAAQRPPARVNAPVAGGILRR